MQIHESVQSLRTYLASLRRAGERVGFVPTMGALHAGHLSLVQLAQQHCDRVVASIFVNPSQFNDPHDLEAYPRPIGTDIQALQSAGAACLFLPTTTECYPPPYRTWVEVEQLTEAYEGAFRPGHFRGVATVVTMLLNMVQPDIAVFGEKDFQQLRMIEQLVHDLKLPVQIVRGPTVRASDGLALSSRNERLSEHGRQTALSLYAGLSAANAAFAEGERGVQALIECAKSVVLSTPGIRLEYLDLIDQLSFEPPDHAYAECRMIVAAFVEEVRLIDNIGLA